MIGNNIMLSNRNLKLKNRPEKLLSLCVGLFKVLQAVGCNTFKLDLPVMLQVYPVFNVVLLHWYMGGRMLPMLIEVDDKTGNMIKKIV